MWCVEKLIEFFVYLRVKYKLEWKSSDYDNKQYCYMYIVSYLHEKRLYFL